jgi:hypothetical protein
MKSLGRLLSAAGASTLLAGAVQACPICILADPRTSGTYLKMTLMMSALPLGLLGGLIYWLKGRYSPPRAALRAGSQAQAQPQHASQLVAHHRI